MKMIRMITLWGLALLCLPDDVHAINCYVCKEERPKESDIAHPCSAEGGQAYTKECTNYQSRGNSLTNSAGDYTGHACFRISVTPKSQLGDVLIEKACTYGWKDPDAVCKQFLEKQSPLRKTYMDVTCSICTEDLCNSATHKFINCFILVAILLPIYIFI